MCTVYCILYCMPSAMENCSLYENESVPLESKKLRVKESRPCGGYNGFPEDSSKDETVLCGGE
jgi:hypothetical protein